MNLETVTDTQSWYKTWQLNGYNDTHVKQKLLRKRKRAYKSSWSRIGNLKSFTLTIPWNLAKLVKISPGIIVHRRLADLRRMVLLREQYAELRKELLRCCCNLAWMTNGGRIPWNVTPICETSQIYYLMGRRPTNDVLENHSEGP